MPHSLRLGAGTHADEGRTWQDFDALLQDLKDEPLPPAAAQASRNNARPISAGVLNSLGLDAAFGQQSGTRPVDPVSFSSFRVPPAPTPPDAGNPSGAADGGSQPVAGTGQTSGTTGNRSLDVVFNAGRIPTLHRAPPASPAPATAAYAGEDRASFQPAVDRQIITAIPPDGLARDTPRALVEPVIPVGLRGSTPVVVPSPIPFAPIMSDKDANALARQLTSLPHGLRERAAKANDVALKAFGFENPVVAAEVRLLASLSQELHERLAKATGEAQAAIEKDIQAVADEIHALEYRGQLRNNTLKLLSQVQPDLKDSLNQDPEQSRLEMHHTVPYKDPKADEARKLLGKWGLSIHDPADAAIVPSSYHRGEDIHGMADQGYSPMVVAALEEADGKATAAAVKSGRKAGRTVMLDALRALSDNLVDGSGDLRAIGLEQTLRKLERPLPRPDLTDPLDWKGYGP
ncbi:MAG: hypothetical protein ACRYGI_02505 [Janthinobacterium lividum]